ncbi:protein Spindly-like [Stegodyphus dumicola]|uniref:protein Spindly-like n=1 Tax=Stegodyphus dumicola TaxID=202533 RepID=UPI0015A7674E|nr:protein Spindly-like [Stegodyphus dumicola]
MNLNEENYLETIALLRTEIKEKDKNLYLAATFGKDLLEEKEVLTSKIDHLSARNEILEQERHSLQIDLDAQIHTAKCQAAELESQREKYDNLYEEVSLLRKENSVLQQKVESLTKECNEFKNTEEAMQLENSILKKRIEMQGEQVKEYQNHLEVSLYESSSHDLSQVQADLNSYIIKNNELADALIRQQYELDEAKMSENRLRQIVKELEENICQRDKELSDYSSEVKKARDEVAELQAEIELLKFEQVDVNRRGNSVFAELDDRRKLVEKNYKLLDHKYRNMLKTYDDNRRELSNCRGQMAILLSMSSRTYQETYIEKLESLLSNAKNEVLELTTKLGKIKSQQNKSIDQLWPSKRDEYDYLKVLYEQSQQKEKQLEKELISLRMKNINDNNILMKAQQSIYHTKEMLDAVQIENMQLKLKLKENPLQASFIVPEDKLNTDVPDLKANEEAMEKTANNDIIFGRLRLGKDGKVQEISPPRRSNRAVLRHFYVKHKEQGDSYISNNDTITGFDSYQDEDNAVNHFEEKSVQKFVPDRKEILFVHANGENKQKSAINTNISADSIEKKSMQKSLSPVKFSECTQQ